MSFCCKLKTLSKIRSPLLFFPLILLFFAPIARRPPVEETTSFLNSLLASHGPNYLEKLFGSKARHRLRELGGVNTVAIALSGKQKLFPTKKTCVLKYGFTWPIIGNQNTEVKLNSNHIFVPY